MRILSSRTKIVKRMTMTEKLEGDEGGKKLLKRRRRLAAPPLPRKKKHQLGKRKRRGLEMSQLKRLSPAYVVCATPKAAPKRRKHLLERRKRSGQEMMKKVFQLRLRLNLLRESPRMTAKLLVRKRKKGDRKTMSLEYMKNRETIPLKIALFHSF